MKPVSIILPTLNERENIIPLIKAINKYFSPAEIIVVDDVSPDGTAELVRAYQKKVKNVRLITNPTSLGLTASIQKGVNQAKGKYVAWMDADFSHPPKVLNKLYEKMTTSDIAIASWLTQGGSDLRREKYTVLRSLLINKICQLLFGSQITAYTSGFVMVRKSLFKNFQLHGDYGEYFIDFVVRNKRYGRKIVEVPFDCISRRHGISKTSPNCLKFLQRSFKYLAMILSLQRSNLCG